MEKSINQKTELKRVNPFLDIIFKILRHKQGLVGGFFVLIIILIAIFAHQIAPYDPMSRDIAKMLEPPSKEHFFGTDIQGRDLLSQIIFGSRITILSGISSVLISMVLGVVLGIISGFNKGKIDLTISAIIDFFLSFPTLILALIVVSILGPGLRNAILAVGFQGIPIFARFIRGEVLVEKEKEYIESAVALGATKKRIVIRHLLPNIFPAIIVMATLELPRVILMLAGLGFIGLGAQPPVLEWGRLIVSNRDFLSLAPWLINFPGIAIMVTVFGFNLLGNALRDILDPSLRG